jgi:hypothetical protein
MTTLRITDLAQPQLNDLQKCAILEAESKPIELIDSAVLAAATKETGLSDFGPPDFLERLHVWLRAGDEDAGLNALGRKVLFDYCVRYAANRLRLEECVARHPEILDEPIERPVFIAGLPRSGTTNLVNLLASDSRWRCLPYWEAIRPFHATKADGDPRSEEPSLRAICEQEWQQLDALLPHLKAIHEMSPDHIHEDLELQALDFTTYNIEWTSHVPGWRDWYCSHPRDSHYRYLRKALQALQWKDRRAGKSPRRWLLKCPQHLENLPTLMQTFPDAVVVLTHRDPVDVIQSAVTAIAYGDRVRRKRIDLGVTTSYWIDRVERLLRACVHDRDQLPSLRSLDVMFPEYIADERGTVAQVYARCDIPLTDQAREAMERYMANHPPGRYGRVGYDFQADFGRDPDEVRSRFAFYLQRWPNVISRPTPKGPAR